MKNQIFSREQENQEKNVLEKKKKFLVKKYIETYCVLMWKKRK